MSTLTIIGRLDPDGIDDNSLEETIGAISVHYTRGKYVLAPRVVEIKNGDLVTIFKDEACKQILWKGLIDFVKPNNDEIVRTSATPNFHHSVQRGMPLDQWWTMFYDMPRATLVRKITPPEPL